MFHVCESGRRQSSFLCPRGTIFNQKHRVCDWWYNVKCEDSTEFYDLNLDLVLLENNRPRAAQRPQLNVPPAIDPFGLSLGLGGGGGGLRSALLQGLGSDADSSSLPPRLTSLGGPSLSSARLMTMLTGRRRNAIGDRRSDDGDDVWDNAIEGDDALRETQFDSSATGSDAGTMDFLHLKAQLQQITGASIS